MCILGAALPARPDDRSLNEKTRSGAGTGAVPGNGNGNANG